jgi:OOP family OmpA-OmpF porin
MGNWARSTGNSNSINQTLVGVDALYLFNRSQLRPFVLFGGGGEYDNSRMQRNVNTPNAILTGATQTFNESGWAPYLNVGVGLQYYLTDQWFTQVDARYKYSWISDSKFNFNTAGDWYFNLGIGYHFGKPPAPPAPRVAPPPAPVVVPPAPKPPPPPPPPPAPQVRNFDLSADALFAFDSATLTPEGKRRIDEVRAALQQAGVVATGDILVRGHTDPIGPLAHNMRLSERRAEAVANYLKSQGVTVPIRTEGVGPKELLVTEADCKAKGQARTKAALIACVAPDRRVTIQATGTVKQ